jgi:hypothetical protein
MRAFLVFILFIISSLISMLFFTDTPKYLSFLSEAII